MQGRLHVLGKLQGRYQGHTRLLIELERSHKELRVTEICLLEIYAAIGALPKGLFRDTLSALLCT